MSDPLEVHAALAGLRYPESVALHPDGGRVACVIDGVAHVAGLDGTLTPLPGGEHALTRWLPDGRLLLASGSHTLRVLDAGLRPLWQAEVAGEIEDLVPDADGTVLVRHADPGSERDGSHLGLRVHDPSDPFVRTLAAACAACPG
ncbi:hypothetical protein ACFQ0B_72475 [Nonomuraea thailandensis]